jgi:hypothetical protein
MRHPFALLVLLAACKPDLGAPPSLIDDARFLAVTSDPPEAKPGDTVTLHALIARPEGQVADDAPATWAICTTPHPVSQNNAVSDDCVFEAQTSIPVRKLEVEATVPLDACARFGPDPPTPKPGEPPLRPVDPDPTGGYFQPVRALLQDTPGHYIAAFALPRITCNLADAPVDVAVDFRTRYVANTNPTIARVLLSTDGSTSVDADRAQVHAGAEVTLLVRWTAASAETYPVFDRVSRVLVDHREALRVSWFATAGALVHDHTGAAEDDPAEVTQNPWTAPTDPGVVHLWVVLRDSRGGTDVRGFEVDVVP